MPTSPELRAWARLASGVADDAIVTTVQDMHRAISRGAYRWLGPVGRPVERVTDRVTAGVYAGVRTGLRAVGELTGVVLSSRMSSRVTPRSAKARAIATGVLDDRYLSLAPELDHPMGLRVGGDDLAVRAADLAAAYPDAGSRVAVFVHGLVDAEAVWYGGSSPAEVNLPEIARAAGATPVLVRYPTGRAITRNGADLHVLLDELVRRWPVPIEELTLIGHSMGGLVIRAAGVQAQRCRARWLSLTRDAIYLGSPHHGSWLEKVANVGSFTLRHASASSAPLGMLLDGRARGIKDLRFGRVLDDADTDRDQHDAADVGEAATGPDVVPGAIDGLLTGRHPAPPWPRDITHHLVVGRLRPAVRHPLNVVFGDGLVRTGSAGERVAIGRDDAGHLRVVPVAARHTHLTDHPEVARLVENVLARQ